MPGALVSPTRAGLMEKLAQNLLPSYISIEELTGKTNLVYFPAMRAVLTSLNLIFVTYCDPSITRITKIN